MPAVLPSPGLATMPGDIFGYNVKIGQWDVTVRIAPYSLGYPVPRFYFIPHYERKTSVGFGGSENLPPEYDVPATASDAKRKASIRKWAKEHQDALVPCPRCAGPAVNRSKFPSQYRNELCEPCWLDDFHQKVQQREQREQQREAAKDAALKAKGYTHKTVAWVHPPSGDDYPLVMHSVGALTDAEIMAQLRKKRSTVLNDYKQTAL